MDLGTTLAAIAPFLMVIVIIWITSRSKLEKKRLELTANTTAEQAALRATNVAELEKRIEVLERIVTDRGYDVATQIEALRDVRSHEDADSGVPLNATQKERI